ncbi:MAG: hypothetical protein ACOYLB_09765 [Phototrophicaceae bacterium]
MKQRFAWLVIVLGSVLMVGVVMFTRWGHAQAQPTTRPTFADELTRLNEQGQPFTLTFTVGLPLWGNSVEINGADGILLERIGSDYACLARPAESITQTVCVPYAQVVGVLFALR